MDILNKFFKRHDFAGLTDTTIANAISGKTFYDVTGQYFTKDMISDANNRVAIIRKRYGIYEGLTEDGEVLVANWTKPIVQKSIDWLFGKGWYVEVPSGNEIVAEVIETVWNGNNKDALCWKIGESGSVTGDAYVQISVMSHDKDGTEYSEAMKKISLRLIPSIYVFPVFDSEDSESMLACLIQYPVVRYEQSEVENIKVAKERLYTQVITKDKVDEYYDEDLVETYENPFGEVNVVHIQNMPNAFDVFGSSDVDTLAVPVEEANNVFADIKDIVEYHAAPTTLIFGARASTLEKGANKVWSNLPVEARVENLELKGDLTAAISVLDFLKLSVHELSGVPEKSLGLVQEISNTSGVALEVQYLPLIEKTRRKAISYGVGLNKINKLIIKAVQKYMPSIKLESAAEFPEKIYDNTVVFNSPLPKDQKELLELADEKLRLKLDSHNSLFKQFNPKDMKSKKLEILADDVKTLLMKYEEAKALQMQLPNITSVATGSITSDKGLFEEFKKMAEPFEKESDSVKEFAERKPEPKPAPNAME